MIGVVLAGGRGRRLRPLTDRIPKPMVPLLGKPLLDYNFQLFKNAGIDRLVLTVCYKKEIIKQHARCGKQAGLQIQYIEETNPLGTAGSLFQTSHLFQKETVIIVSGDALTNTSLQEAYAFHKEKKARVTIVTAPSDRPEQFGVCLFDQQKRLLRLLEKPKKETLFTNEVSTGIYLIESDVFSDYEFFGEADFAKNVFPALLQNNEPVFVYQTNAYWQDIGTFQAFRLAEKQLKRGIPGINRETKRFYPLLERFSANFLLEEETKNIIKASSLLFKKQAGISEEKVIL